MSLLDSILDSKLEDLADLPEFLTPPAGAYRASVLSMSEKSINNHPAVETRFKLLETYELANPEDTAVADGTECSVAYMLDNEFGVGNLKALVAPLAASLGVGSTREVMEQCKGTEVLLITSIRSKGENKYFTIKKLEVL